MRCVKPPYVRASLFSKVLSPGPVYDHSQACFDSEEQSPVRQNEKPINQ